MRSIFMLLVFISWTNLAVANPKSPKLKIDKSFQLPLQEISALAIDYKVKGNYPVIIAIGDQEAKAVSFVFDPKDLHNVKEMDFTVPIIRRFSLCYDDKYSTCEKIFKKITTDWEAAAIDAEGEIFVSQEHSRAIPVFDHEMKKVLYIINLDFPDLPRKLESQHKMENNLVEGMLLLKNGHILVAKQKSPGAFIEFGPEGDSALGVSKNTILPSTEKFSFRGNIQDNRLLLKPLHVWLTSSKCNLSDIATDQDGKIFVTSPDCSQIIQFAKLTPETKEAQVENSWELPKEIESPEGLIKLKDDEFLVAVDIPLKKKPNLFLLSVKK